MMPKEQLAKHVRTRLAIDGYVVVDDFFGDDFQTLRNEVECERRGLGDVLHETSNYMSLWAFRDNERVREYFTMAYNADVGQGMLSCRAPLVDFTPKGPTRTMAKVATFLLSTRR